MGHSGPSSQLPLCSSCKHLLWRGLLGFLLDAFFILFCNVWCRLRSSGLILLACFYWLASWARWLVISWRLLSLGFLSSCCPRVSSAHLWRSCFGFFCNQFSLRRTGWPCVGVVSSLAFVSTWWRRLTSAGLWSVCVTVLFVCPSAFLHCLPACLSLACLPALVSSWCPRVFSAHVWRSCFGLFCHQLSF